MIEKVVREIKRTVQPYRGAEEKVVATRTFMLRVAKREGWSVVAEIRDSSDNDPMDAYFQDKLASAKLLAKNKQTKIKESSSPSGLLYTSIPVGFGV
ncbi:10106_t:CDS:2 [Dentiscutata heterogama]|uniref:10106_t:CDS:1 n=1 Tax=Dentiscutata heterogama TaxID=1316150 RepID=A0ACA9M7N1_9GLOM|nr:10106_t:CDS:2 [Dentiscutata heterogama]